MALAALGCDKNISLTSCKNFTKNANSRDRVLQKLHNKTYILILFLDGAERKLNYCSSPQPTELICPLCPVDWVQSFLHSPQPLNKGRFAPSFTTALKGQ